MDDQLSEADEKIYDVVVEKYYERNIAPMLKRIEGTEFQTIDEMLDAYYDVYNRYDAAAIRSGVFLDFLIDKGNLRQISDEDTLGKFIEAVWPACGKAIASFQGGQTKALGFIIGAVLKESGGRGNPDVIQRLVRAKLQ